MPGHSCRLAAFNVTLLGAAALLLSAFPSVGPPLATDALAAGVLITVLFAVAEHFAVHFEFRENAYSVALVELPLVLGLLLCSPRSLVAARVLGGLVTIAFVQRQSGRKLAGNTALFAFEAAVAGAVFRGVLIAAGGAAPRMVWLAAFTATLVAVGVSATVVAALMRLSGGSPRLREMGRVAALSGLAAFATTGLALTGVTLYQVDPASLVLVVGMTAIPLAAYSGYGGLQQRYRALQEVYEFTRVLSGSPELHEAVRTTLQQARRLLQATTAELLLLDGEGRDAPMRVSAAGDSGSVTSREAVAGDPVWRRLRTEPSGLVVPRGARDARLRAVLTSRAATDLLAAPLLQGAETVGVLLVCNRLGSIRSFDDEDYKVLATLANHAAVSIENARLIDRLRTEVRDREHQALHDALTGLGNRNLFAQRSDEALRRSRAGGWRVAVLLADLNRFKDVNDTLGHMSGDRLLQEVARRLAHALPSSVTVARLGGDEFAILVPRVASDAEAVAAARTLSAALDAPLPLDGLDLTVSASIGIAVSPAHGDDPATLLQRADIAMYAAKERDHGIAVYSPDRDARSTRRLALAGELRETIRSGQMAVCYQPKASLVDGAVSGVEALARWHHPSHGPIPPDEFIPLAEHVGLIGALTEQVLTMALDQLAAWQTAGLDLQMAVNLSVHSLLDLDLPVAVGRLLAAKRIAPDRLILEVTESQIMSDPERTLGVLAALDALGVRLSIDDFGTGYSSLSYLKRLPVHEVKIDKSFVRNMASDDSDVTIVRSVIDLSRSLGLHVVAEGVEDQMSWDLLAALGCDTAQGYYLSRPVPADRLTPWLQQRRPAGRVVPALPRPASPKPAPMAGAADGGPVRARIPAPLPGR